MHCHRLSDYIVFQANSGLGHLPDKSFAYSLLELKHLCFAFTALQLPGYYPDFHPRYFHHLPCNSRFPGRITDYWSRNGTKPSPSARGYTAIGPNEFKGTQEELTFRKKALFLF